MKTVVFRPTNSCNLRCTYCYDKNNHGTDEGTIRKNATELFKKEENDIIRSLSILYTGEKKPHIIFHGGEPLLIETKALDNFCKRLQDETGVTFSIQTNATLITDEVMELFKRYRFEVGLSLDGCNEIQNQARIFPNGHNSFNAVLNNIKKLQDNKIKFGVIMSITNAHKNSEWQMYDFIANQDISCNIRPVFASDTNDISQIMTAEEYARFFNNLFDIWFNDEKKKVKTHQIFEIYQALKKELDPTYRDKSCNSSNRCFKDFISMDVLSNLYACNRLYGIDKFYYGNLKTDSIELINEKIEALLNERNNAIKTSCASCDVLEDCYGGCPAESYDIYKDILHPSANCKVKKLVASHVKEKLL